MQFTKRESILLKILGIAILVFLFYQFIMKPQLDSINILKTQSETYRMRVNNYKKEIQLKDKLDEEYKVINYKISSITERLFPILEQEKIIVILDDMIRESNIQVRTLAFSEPKDSEIIKQEKAEEETTKLEDLFNKFNGVSENKNNDKNDANEKKTEESKLNNMNVTLNYEGSYNSLMKFLTLIETYKKEIIVKSVNGVQGEEFLAGNIVLEFYSIPKINDQDEDIMKWKFNNKYGKENPFINYNTIMDYRDIEDKSMLYDFAMTVSPISSDLPTIILGQKDDKDMETLVFADNENIENVEVYFMQEGDKYYYKYKTETESYPKDFDKLREVKVLQKSIGIDIFSYKRNSPHDNAGVNIKIYNKTDKNVIVKITNDDKERPRVTVENKEGKINIINE